jgi:hypothetical protein
MDTIDECQLTQEELGWLMYMIGENVRNAAPVLLVRYFDAKDTRHCSQYYQEKSSLEIHN